MAKAWEFELKRASNEYNTYNSTRELEAKKVNNILLAKILVELRKANGTIYAEDITC